ncbi:unnamed protein product [Meloidogyne enterolobii]|uniref:Uncharacterized protein n=1 Tax=Meloidogyne enterolobii TaxID=390850 RepID=A0ACB0XQW9_MELEN
MWAVFHNSGTIPVLNVFLYKIERGRAKGVAHFFRKYWLIFSGLWDNLFGSFFNSFSIIYGSKVISS